jgi:hypothetical protein
MIVPGDGDGVTGPCTNPTVVAWLLVFSIQKRFVCVLPGAIEPENPVIVAFVVPSVYFGELKAGHVPVEGIMS